MVGKLKTYNEYIGKLRKVVFYNENTKYIVARIDEENEGKSMTITGNMYSYKENQRYKFYGEIVFHPKYGKQIKFTSYEEIVASDEEEVVRYLSSTLFKGIGKVVAQRIVDELGPNAIAQIMEDKLCLKGIKGITDEKIETIYNTLIDENKDNRTVQYLMKYNFTMGVIDKLITAYEDETLEMMQLHPYSTISQIEGLSFKMVDQYALSIGYDQNNEERLEALITYIIQEYCFQNGHTYIDEERLFYHIDRYDPTLHDLCIESLASLIKENKIIVREDRYFLASFERCEQGIYEGIQGYLQKPLEEGNQQDIDDEITRIEKKEYIEYSPSQKQAIYDFMSYPFMILTGGPGTGKTTIVKACIEIYRSLNEQKNVVLCAPTGRAAKRLNELTGLDATTIHRLLKWDMNTNEFGINEDNPIQCDLLVIDEFSMVDTFLFYNLLKACLLVEKILIIGDEKQLPSVMPGQILSDLLKVNGIHYVELKEIFRQKENSGIITLSHKIRKDEAIPFDFFEDYHDVFFLNSKNIFGILEKLVLKAIDDGYDENEIQVLAPMYKGEFGIDAINRFLQNMLNPYEEYKTQIKVGNKIYRVGDKVLQLKNRMDDNVFNGDIGIIEEIHFKGLEYLTDTIIINYDGTYVEYGSADFIEFTHAYCMSIHKSQGSEFKIVFLILTMDFYPMLQKNLIYTAITRAKQTLIIAGEYKAFSYGIQASQERVRNTYLKERFLSEKHEMSPYDFMDEGEQIDYFEDEDDDLSPYDYM